jgi:hypothetical protein
MKIFISQKFRDLSEEEILKRKSMIIDLVKTKYEDAEIIENWHPDFDKNSISQLGQSIIEMSDAELVLLSDTSVNNIISFVYQRQDPELIKGSETEALICFSYNIPFKVYGFVLDEDNKATSVNWLEWDLERD